MELPPLLTFECSAEVWHWRGPAPFHFVSIPEAESDAIREIASMVSYGWGMIPAVVTVGGTRFRTAAFAKNGLYALPLKDAVRWTEGIQLGDVVTMTVEVAPRR